MSILNVPLPEFMKDDHIRIFEDSVVRFLDDNAPPERVARWRENGMVEREFWSLAGQMGMLGVSLPERYGGAGGDFRHDLILIDQVVRKEVSGFAVSLHNGIVTPYVLAHGTDEQKQRWLPRLADGTFVAAVAMSEPGVGSDHPHEREDHHRDHPADGVAVTVVAEQAAEHDRDDGEGDDDARYRQAAPGPHGVRAERGVRHRPGGRRSERRAPARQVGEQPGEVGPGPRLKRAPGPVVELVLREPPGLEVLAQLGDRLIPLGVRHAHATAREAPGFGVHGRCPSLLAPWPKCWL